MIDGSEIIVQIRDLNERGQGVGTAMHDPDLQGKVCFVDGALPGETVRARLVEDKARYRVLELLEVLDSSPDRVLSDCEYFPDCGSCQLRHMSYEAELQFKEKRVRDLLTRHGPLQPEDPAFLPIIGMAEPFYYRSKSIFPIQKENNDVTIGQYRRGTHELIDLFHCKLHSDIALSLVNAVRELAIRDKVSIYNETLHAGTLRHLVVRKAVASDEVMLIFVVNDRKADDTIASWIFDLKTTAKNKNMSLRSSWLNIMDVRGNRVLSDDYELLDGDKVIAETINEVRYNISPDSFFQVNPVQAAVLFQEVIESATLKAHDRVLDLYSGVGALALQLGFAAKDDSTISITGVDIVEQAIADAKENATLNELNNLEFIRADATQWLSEYESDENNLPFNVMVVDPPRKGLDPEAIDVMKRSGADRIVYVSCNPATLARDLTLFTDCYKVERVRPVDMFPRTTHVETVVLMSRKG